MRNRTAVETHPSVMASDPTSPDTAPWVSAPAMAEVAALERCCHSAAIRDISDATAMESWAAREKDRAGNGLTSRSEPSEPSSVCQWGYVARRI